MDQPTGLEVPRSEGKVCHLLKAIYGLKQAGCQWHEHLQGTLSTFGYTKLISSDVSIFVKHHDEGDQVTIILVYIDDMALFSSSKNIKEIKSLIGSRYQYTDMDEIEYFLGLHIVHDHSKRTISVDPTCYIQRMLKHFDMLTYQPTYTPFSVDTILTANPEKRSDSPLMTHYQQIIGSLMYAMLGT